MAEFDFRDVSIVIRGQEYGTMPTTTLAMPLAREDAARVMEGDPPRPDHDHRWPTRTQHHFDPHDPELLAWSQAVDRVAIDRTRVNIILHHRDFILEAELQTIDVRSREEVGIYFRAPCPQHAPDDISKLCFIYSLLRWVVLHELRECFLVDGRRCLEQSVESDHGRIR